MKSKPLTTLMGLVAAGLICGAGCVQRVIRVTSEPTGALVYLNDEEIGRTPVAVPFTYYGTYDVRLEHDDYQPLWTQKQAHAPWWEAPGPDLIAEAIPDVRVQLDWHFKMQLVPVLDEGRLLERALQTRAKLGEAVETDGSGGDEAASRKGS